MQSKKWTIHHKDVSGAAARKELVGCHIAENAAGTALPCRQRMKSPFPRRHSISRCSARPSTVRKSRRGSSALSLWRVAGVTI
jgi:hypothetical protein